MAGIWGDTDHKGVVSKNLSTHLDVSYDPELDSLELIHKGEKIYIGAYAHLKLKNFINNECQPDVPSGGDDE